MTSPQLASSEFDAPPPGSRDAAGLRVVEDFKETFQQDPAAKRRLQRMKLLAGAFLLCAASLYVLSFFLSGQVAGFLRAGSEAAMVGGLADWFAVTALFRHPFGLPVPHTAMIPRQKDEIATKLGDFVTGHFFTREVVTRDLMRDSPFPRIGQWLAEPETSSSLSREVAFGCAAALKAIEDESVVNYVMELLRRDAARRSYGPVLGRALARAVAAGDQVPPVQILAGLMQKHLAKHPPEIVKLVLSTVNGNIPWILGMARWSRDDAIEQIDKWVELLREIETNRNNDIRLWLDKALLGLAADLQTDTVTRDKVNELTNRMLRDDRTVETLRDIIGDATLSVSDSLAEPNGALQASIAKMIETLGDRLQHDDAFRQRLDDILQRRVGDLIDRYGFRVTSLIRRQVEGWPAKNASRTIELAVGRDLQFIRINGTIIGALAGLVIHAATVVAT